MLRCGLWLLAKPFLWLLLGLAVSGRQHFPREGPALVAANHNSHVDILALLTAMPWRTLDQVRPVGAADYFLATPMRRFLAMRLLRGIALDRTVARGADPLAPVRAALEAGDILVLFPEGTRGQPEEMGPVKAGLSKLATQCNAPIVPVYLQGAGRILPKGTRVPVPFVCSVLVGPPIAPDGDRAATMEALKAAWGNLRDEAPPLHWH